MDILRIIINQEALMLEKYKFCLFSLSITNIRINLNLIQDFLTLFYKTISYLISPTSFMITIFYKIIYNPAVNYIIRNIGFFFNKTIKTNFYFPVSGIIKFRSPTNKSFYLKTNETCFVTNYLFWKGTYNYESTPLYCQIFKISRSFLDIGSNVGLFSILAEVENPNIRTDSFDPSPSSYYFTSINVKFNKLKNTYVNRLALTDKKSEVIFHEVLLKKYLYRNYHLSGASSIYSDFIQKGREYKVNTTSIDEYVKENKLPHVDFIKIDAERAEPLIIKGATKTIQRFFPIIYCEILFGMMNEMNLILSYKEYKIFHLKNNRLYPVADPYNLIYDADHDFLFIPLAKINMLEKFIS
ncbi:MAG: FkbM family methyltransferase [Saprospiraceae bacterium]|nr:FkbM family methyltransferase [Saprospiraceae bacterium]